MSLLVLPCDGDDRIRMTQPVDLPTIQDGLGDGDLVTNILKSQSVLTLSRSSCSRATNHM